MLNFSFLEIIRFLHPRCLPKILDILKNAQKTSASVLMTYMNTDNENDFENEK